MRAYTVYELDALRRVVETKYLYGRYHLGIVNEPIMGRSFREDEKEKIVEEQVRTHMLAGHTAQDLINSESAPSEE